MNNKFYLKKMSGVCLLLAASASALASGQNFDVRVSPAVFLIGITDAEINFKVNENITIAPMFTYYKPSFFSDIADEGDEYSANSYGARMYWHLGGVFKDGMYISPFYRLWNLSATVNVNDFGNRATGSVTGTEFGATIGYLWQWDNFNTNIGIGYKAANFGDIAVKDDLGNETTLSSSISSSSGVAFDLSIGFAF